MLNLSLCLINYALGHEDIWESGGTAPSSLTLEVDGNEWSASRLCRFIHGKKSTVTIG
jgi:hypothetical protein